MYLWNNGFQGMRSGPPHHPGNKLEVQILIPHPTQAPESESLG